jgi:EAL domain-containing protein (putative c-di-GMP-specific phosphodiesterase class I)
MVDLVSDLQSALERGDLTAAYQPQVELGSLKIVAAEALARWNHPEFGAITPGVFIPLAEQHGLIHDIGVSMVEFGTRQAAQWDALGLEIDISVNVSPRQLEDLDFLDHLQRNLGELALPPGRLVLEITESLPVPDVDEVRVRLRELRELGLGISIDDFGAGYSVLIEQTGIPATELKLDRALIQDETPSVAFLRTVVDSAHSQGMRVVAEGVETESHLALARELRCDRGQGYLFGRPMSAAALQSLVEPAEPPAIA